MVVAESPDEMGGNLRFHSGAPPYKLAPKNGTFSRIGCKHKPGVARTQIYLRLLEGHRFVLQQPVEGDLGTELWLRSAC